MAEIEKDRMITCDEHRTENGDLVLTYGVPGSAMKCGIDPSLVSLNAAIQAGVLHTIDPFEYQKEMDDRIKEACTNKGVTFPGFGEGYQTVRDQVDTVDYALELMEREALSNQKIESFLPKKLKDWFVFVSDANPTKPPPPTSSLETVRSDVMEKLLAMLGTYTMATVLQKVKDLEKPYVSQIEMLEMVLAERDNEIAELNERLRMVSELQQVSNQIPGVIEFSCSVCGKSSHKENMSFDSVGSCICNFCKFKYESAPVEKMASPGGNCSDCAQLPV